MLLHVLLSSIKLQLWFYFEEMNFEFKILL